MSIRDKGTELESLTEWLLIMEDLTGLLQEVSETERGAGLVLVVDELGGHTAGKIKLYQNRGQEG